VNNPPHSSISTSAGITGARAVFADGVLSPHEIDFHNRTGGIQHAAGLGLGEGDLARDSAKTCTPPEQMMAEVSRV
jgi:hypothetical protein